MENKKENTKYLYGAAVQGIQGFIFQTNKLKEIVGASELVEQICTTAFNDYGGKVEEGKSILRAAGNIKHIFDKKEDCEKTVREFPRKVMKMAPGITISQAVVLLKDDASDYAEQAKELEQHLRTQRNKPVRSLTLGLMAISRAPSTGLPAVKQEGKELIDEGSVKKTDKDQSTKTLMIKMTGDKSIKHDQIAYDFDKLEGKNSWIAVIHADGNGMGNIVQAICKNPKDAKIFSTAIESITKKAAQVAYCHCGLDPQSPKVIPLRPVVLGGDDLTLICRADLAVQFTKIFMETFEAESVSQLGNAQWEKTDWRNAKDKPIEKKLTVCAGIAFIKSSYPFHYAVELAESLCGRAKKAAKKINADLVPSCLMFHKVQDSFVEEFSEIAKRELTPQPNLSFEYGPYYLVETWRATSNMTTIQQLKDNIQQLEGKEGNAIKSHLRQWLSLLFDNVDVANQKMKRLRTVNTQAKSMIPECFENLNGNTAKKIPYHDILSLSSILTQETKKGGNENE